MTCTANKLSLLAGSIVAPALFSGVALADGPFFFSPRQSQLADCADDYWVPSVMLGTDNFYTLHPHPAWWGSAPVEYNTGVVHCSWEEMQSTGRAAALVLGQSSVPWPGATTAYPVDYPYYTHASSDDPLTLQKAIHNRYYAGGSLDIIYADLEPHEVANGWDDIEDMMAEYIEIARGDRGDVADPFGLSNPDVSATTIAGWNVIAGNYNVAPRAYGTITQHNSAASPQPTYTGHYTPWGVNWTQAKGGSEPHRIFDELDMKLSMPVTFIRGEMTCHMFGRDHWSDPAVRCPTPRSAMLWASLERYSTGAREYPGNDGVGTPGSPPEYVIPWVAPYFNGQIRAVVNDSSSVYYAGWFPPAEDFLALIQHFRLRGADGYVFFAGNVPGHGGWYDGTSGNLIGYYEDAPWFDSSADFYTATNRLEWFEENTLVAWEDLEFSDDAVPYRMETSKDDGYFLSAVNDYGHLVVLVSNLNDSSPGGKISVDLDDYFPGTLRYDTFPSPTSTMTVGDEEHVVSYEFFTPDIDGDHDVDCDDKDLYTARFVAGDMRLDWNGDSVLDLSDVAMFTTAYSGQGGPSTCP